MRTVLVVLLSAICATILTACALLTPTLEPVPAPDAARVACDSFRRISWYPGDKQSAAAILAQVKKGDRAIDEQTLDFLRATLGDTDQTVFEVKAHNAAYRAICPDKPPVPSVKVKDGIRLRSSSDTPQASPLPDAPRPHRGSGSSQGW